MDLIDTWNNYKSLLAIITNNNQNSIKDFFNKLCSPVENLTNSKKLTQLFAMAVEFKNCEIVSALLQHGVRGKPCEELFKYTPMQCAVISGYVSLILEMVQCGATYNDIDNDGNTLLHLAILNKNERWKNLHINVSKQFVKSETEIVVASMLKILLDLGLNVDVENKKGETPLCLAVQYRMKVITELLVEHNASLNIFGKMVTHFLIMDEVVSFRRKSCDDEGLWMKQQKIDFMDWWFSKKLDINSQTTGETPLQLCVRYNMKNVLQILFKYTNEIHDADSVGRSLLHILFGSIENALRVNRKNCETERTIDIVNMLIERGISVNTTDKCGNTPIHIAAKLKRPEILKVILGHFTNVNTYNNMRETALHVVAKNCCDKYENEYFEIICDLVNKGADCNVQDRYGKTPLHFVCLKNTKISKRIVEFLIERGCDVNITDENDVTPLYLAVQWKNIEIAEILLNNKANVNCCKKFYNSTPLHEATKKNLVDMVEMLLKAGAKPDIRDTLSGQTPLHVIVSDQLLTPAIMSLLLMFGADVEVVDKEDKTPLYRAFCSGDYDRVAMLLDFGAKISCIERSRLIPTRSESTKFNKKTLIIKHLVAQTVAGLFVRNYYATVVQRAQREFSAFYQQCTQELDLLKITTIEDIAVYDLLRMNVKRRFTYMTKNTFMRFATDYEFLKDKFPVYRHIISATYWTVVRRKPLLDSAKDVWHRLTNVSLPEFCIEQILEYLENSDLKFIIEAVN